MVDKETIPFQELYNLNQEDYSHIKIVDLNFSMRLTKCLLSVNVMSVSDLLKLSVKEISEIKGLGKLCRNELLNYFSHLQEHDSDIPVYEVKITRQLQPFIKHIIKGDFSFADALRLSSASEEFLNSAVDGYKNLGTELVEKCCCGAKEIFDIKEMMERYVKDLEKRKKCDDLSAHFSEKRLSSSIKILLFAYNKEDKVIKLLTSYKSEETNTLREYILENKDRVIEKDHIFTTFIKWCMFDVHAEIDEYFAKLFLNKRNREIITMRAGHCTLEQVGCELGVTRERVRQIEKKLSLQFAGWQRSNSILFKIFADSGEEAAMSSTEIAAQVGRNGVCFIYMLKINAFDNIIYDKQLDMFIFEDHSLVERIQTHVESLPDTFTEIKAAEFISAAESNFGYPAKMVAAAIEDNYRKTGVTYHRSRLTLENLYPAVLRQFYPEGMHVYDEKEIIRFKEIVKSEYGIELTQSNRAIAALIGRVGMLCGRGLYRSNDGPFISKELAQKIYDYIQSSQEPVFMTNTLFSIFEEELAAEGIKNKYFLQGILRDLYDDKWTFRRDYISKDESTTSIYSGIVNFIKKSLYPIKKQELFDNFPGVTDIVFNIATSDPNILNLFGEYLHSCHLKLSDDDIKYLKNVIDHKLRDREVCHCRELFEYVNDDNPALLSNNFVYYPFCMYSLLEYLFRDFYNFSRPFIASLDVHIEHVCDVLRDMVKESDKIAVVEISSFAQEYHFQINSILDFIDSCNETHFLINRTELMQIADTGVTKESAQIVERLILGEIEGTMPIAHLQCLSLLPQVKVPWNEWLIYSILKKWSSELAVAASHKQFRHAVPLVARKGQLKREEFEDLSDKNVGSMAIADDLSKIDSLIADYILDNLGESI